MSNPTLMHYIIGVWLFFLFPILYPQVLEQIDMTKDVQYRVLSILRKLVHHYPNFMALEKRDLLIKLSINMIFVKQVEFLLYARKISILKW